MKLHEIKSRLSEISGRDIIHDDNSGVVIPVLGDEPDSVAVVRDRLDAAGVPYSQSKHRKFKGAFFTIHLRNTGTAFAANWEFA